MNQNTPNPQVRGVLHSVLRVRSASYGFPRGEAGKIRLFGTEF